MRSGRHESIKKDKENSEAFRPGLGFLSGNWTAFTQAGWEASGSDADVLQCSGSTSAIVLSVSVRLEIVPPSVV